MFQFFPFFFIFILFFSIPSFLFCIILFNKLKVGHLPKQVLQPNFISDHVEIKMAVALFLLPVHCNRKGTDLYSFCTQSYGEQPLVSKFYYATPVMSNTASIFNLQGHFRTVLKCKVSDLI